MTRSSTPALWDAMPWLVTTLKPRRMVSLGNALAGTLSWTRCFLSCWPPKPKLLPWETVCLSHVMPDTAPLRSTLVLVESISPRSMTIPLISTKNLSAGVQSSIW